MKNDKEYLKDIYDKYEKLKSEDNLPDFYLERPKRKRVRVSSIAVGIAALLVVSVISIFVLQRAMNVNEKGMISNENKDKIWTEGFQLAWNDVSYNYTNGPVLFEDFNNDDEIVALSNKNIDNHMFANSYNLDEIKILEFEDNQYNVARTNDAKIKDEIANNNSLNSALANSSNFAMNNMVFRDNENELTIYSAFGEEIDLGKNFVEVPARTFNTSYDKYKFFGMDEEAYDKVKENVAVLFYNSADDFAISVVYNEDELILYRTDNEESFDAIYEEIYEKKVDGLELEKNDILEAPWINVDEGIIYDELIGKKVIGEDELTIKNIGQDIAFNLKASSEKKVEGNIDEVKGKEYIFDGNFVLFLKKEYSEVPYFALRVDDTNYLVKE